jgi:hypothetical protein
VGSAHPILETLFTKLNRTQLRKVIGDIVEGYDYGWFGSLKANISGRRKLLSDKSLKNALRKLLPQVQSARTEAIASLFDQLVSVQGIEQSTPTLLLAI